MSYNPRDHYFKKAKKENYAARSIFKLEEIDKKYKLFKPGQLVLDLGAAPGSWAQYASKQIGEKGRVLGLDLTEITIQLKNAIFIQADLRDINLPIIFEKEGFLKPFDIVMSDMAPKTTGIRSVDQARSAELCEIAFESAQKFLRPGGHFVCKLFHSDDFSKLRDLIKRNYDQFHAVKPDSTRKISKEIFLVGLKKK